MHLIIVYSEAEVEFEALAWEGGSDIFLDHHLRQGQALLLFIIQDLAFFIYFSCSCVLCIVYCVFFIVYFVVVHFLCLYSRQGTHSRQDIYC